MRIRKSTHPRYDGLPAAEPGHHAAGAFAAVNCVFLTASEWDAQILARLVAPAGIQIHHAFTLEQADFLLIVSGASVLLADPEVREGSWKDALNMLQRVHPSAVLVAAVNHLKRDVWIGILEEGAYDLVQKPFCAEELERVLKDAHAYAQHKTAPGTPMTS